MIDTAALHNRISEARALLAQLRNLDPQLFVQRDQEHDADEIIDAVFEDADKAVVALDALRSEILTLRARLGNIADLTTMPMPPDWTKHNM
jgi:transcriptional regulator